MYLLHVLRQSCTHVHREEGMLVQGKLKHHKSSVVNAMAAKYRGGPSHYQMIIYKFKSS